MTVAVPVATAVTSPVLETVATLELLVFQVALLVTLLLELFEKFAVAASCCVCPAIRLTLEGETVTLVTVELLTVNPVWAMTLPDLAAIVVVPRREPAVARPALLMVAILVAVELQVTEVVASPVVLLPKVAVAVYCCTPPGAMLVFKGETVRATIAFAEGKKLPQAVNDTQIATAARKAKTSSWEYTDRCTLLWYHRVKIAC